MIKIINDWYITVETSPVNYTVRRGEGKKDKKNAWADKPIAFFGSLQKAVKFIRDQVIAEELSSFPKRSAVFLTWIQGLKILSM